MLVDFTYKEVGRFLGPEVNSFYSKNLLIKKVHKQWPENLLKKLKPGVVVLSIFSNHFVKIVFTFKKTRLKSMGVHSLLLFAICIGAVNIMARVHIIRFHVAYTLSRY